MSSIWKYTVQKVKMTDEQRIKLFHYGANSYKIDKAPKEIKELEEGYYMVVETGEFFSIKNHMLEEWNIHVHDITFGLRRNNVLRDYLETVNKMTEQGELGKVLSEITVFDNDLYTPLEFSNGVATMKPYFYKSIEVSKHDDIGWYSIHLDGVEVANVIYNDDMEKYSSYDGVDGCGWYDNIKKAVKSFMDSNYRYPTDVEYYEASCSNCGDGGCMYCEPHRFI